MRTTLRAITFALTVGAIQPAILRAQAPNAGHANATAVLTIQVPAIVKTVVTEGADGIPVVRVVTNDPRLRAATANGVVPERLVTARVVATPEQSARAKGDEALEPLDATGRVVRYTVVAP